MIICMMPWLRSGFLLMLLASVDSSRINTDWFTCGTEHLCKFFGEGGNWHDAEAACNAEFGHLASISTAEDRDIIANKTGEITVDAFWITYLNTVGYWIGLNHLAGLQDHWRFTDGETVNSSMWARGYPYTMTPYGLIGMCGAERYDGFHNENCGRIKPFVCKKLNGTTQSISAATTKEPPREFYCPTGYTAINPREKPNMGEKCFKFVFLNNTNGVDWNEAVKRCRTQGRKADIASIHGPYEQEFIRSQMVNRTFGLWIGLHRLHGSYRPWGWMDNSAYTEGTVKWHCDRWDCPRTECVEVMSIPNAAKLNPLECDQPRGYICQIYKDPDNPITEQPPSPEQNCLDGYSPYKYGCYRLLSDTHQSWAEMRDECRSHSTDTIKSDLVSIHSSAEDATLHIKVMQFGETAWIGLKKNKDNTFEWSNNWYPTYTNWRSTEGNDMEYMGCFAMDNGINGGWYELSCTTPLAGICKTTVEEPTKAPSVNNGSCPDDFRGGNPWLKHESYCYLPVSERKTWREARLHCANQNFTATLVSIHSESENKFVHENMPEQSSWSSMAWIGLYRDTQDDGFIWSDGSPLQFEKWNLGGPNGDNNTDCVGMYTTGHDRLHWYGAKCEGRNPFMCKAEQGSPLEPPPEHTGTCPDGWHKFGASCYLAFPDTLTWWHEAEENCQIEGGNPAHLAAITNKFQSDFINDLMMETSSYNFNMHYWFGLNHRRGEPMYRWVGIDEEYSARRFHMFPNGFIQTPQWDKDSCVAVRENRDTENTRWIVQDCDRKAGYVCELPVDEAGSASVSGKIAGFVIGVLIAVGLFAFIIVYLYHRQCIIIDRQMMDANQKLCELESEI